jgi:hypothetical protein
MKLRYMLLDWVKVFNLWGQFLKFKKLKKLDDNNNNNKKKNGYAI